ncbi:MAG: hypothetical protein ACKOC5_02010 [Chloroflexota bacterium]
MSTVSDQQIRAFVAAWYQALDFHFPIEQVYPLLASEGLVMAFPDGDIKDHASFKVWYDRVTNLFFDENHFVNQVKITPDGECFVLDILVGWQASWWEAPAPKSKRVSMDATQRWIVRPTDRNAFGLEIQYYNATVEPFKYAPGFAQL